jgi:hypothetical protein
MKRRSGRSRGELRPAAADRSSPLTSPASSQPLPDRVTPEQVASILKDAGYRAEILADKSPQRIRTGIGGRTVLVALYDCQT